MTNFNGINPWANMLNYLNTIKQNEINPSNQQPLNMQNPAQAQSATLNQLNNASNIFSKTTQSYLNPANEAQTAEQAVIQDILKMNNEIVQKYLQSMLNMPESFDAFLKFANSKDISANNYQFLKLFVENMLNNKELSQLLNENSNNAIQKLLNVISQAMRQSGADTSQLKEILSVLNTIHTSTTLNTNTLRELFLLYIPIDYQIYKQESDFGKITAENEEAINEGTLSILFETYNYSNILITLNENQNIITAQLYASSDFPYERFKSIITTLSKDINISVLCEFIKIKECGTKGQKQNFRIISNNYVSTNILNISQLIIKTIFKLDYDMQEALEA